VETRNCFRLTCNGISERGDLHLYMLHGSDGRTREGQTTYAGGAGDLAHGHPLILPGNTMESHGLILVALGSFYSNRTPYLLKLTVIWITCCGFRVVCGISSRRVATHKLDAPKASSSSENFHQ
jgi:hypothetical protein